MQTPYGNLQILPVETIYKNTVQALKDLNEKTDYRLATVGLAGGNTAKGFYKWAIDTEAVHMYQISSIRWHSSDERYVDRDDPESNIGTAREMFLTPLRTPLHYSFPWQTYFEDPKVCVRSFNRHWNDLYSEKRCFDICFLGMGEDGHTASIFPGSPLLEKEVNENFALVEDSPVGTRCTITPHGLRGCGRIIVTIIGKNKAERLKKVFQGEYDPKVQPIQILKMCADKVTWFVDEEAGSLIKDMVFDAS